MKIKYNSPVILTYALLCTLVLVFSLVLGTDSSFQHLFILHSNFDFGSLVDYFSLFSYVLGHANWSHLIGNFSLILVVGPMLEEKYGSSNLLAMMLITAIVSAIFNLLFMNNNVLGASGIVFMLILLSSFTGFRDGNIPMTFVLVFVLYIGKEVMNSFEPDNISQFGHIMGGICGGFFGFWEKKSQEKVISDNSQVDRFGSY
jgi:membrane associated rhomboid family serine protease